MDCPVCREHERSNLLKFQFGGTDNIPGDIEAVDEPEEYPTHALCTYDEDHFFIVEVDQEDDILLLILEGEDPLEDDVYEFVLSDFEFELS